MSQVASSEKDLVPVHGGLARPVDRRVPLSERKAFLKEAEALESVRVSNADLATVHRIADGALSPLTGPMSESVWHSVLDEHAIETEGGVYAWTIPLSLPISDDEARKLSPGGSVALKDEAGEIVALVGLPLRKRQPVGTALD